jgi:hypothetical protein
MKFRTLSLATLAAQKVNTWVPYSEIAKELSVDLKEVEQWIITGKLCIFFFTVVSFYKGCIST